MSTSEHDNQTNTKQPIKTSMKPNPKKSRAYEFHPNSNFFTICVYGLVFVTLATLIIMAIVNWGKLVGFLQSVLSALTPFVIAFFIAYILNPLVKRFERLLGKRLMKNRSGKARKITAIAITYMLVLACFSIVILYITPELINSAKDLDNSYKKINLKDVEKTINNFLSGFSNTFPGLNMEIIENKVNDMIPKLFNYGTDAISYVLSLSVSVVRIIINFLLAFVISCYMLADKHSLKYNIKRLTYCILPKKTASSFIQTLKECNIIFSKFIVGKSIDSLIIGLICFVAMTILRLDYAVLLSIIVGVTNMIPYFGPFIGAIPGVLIYLFLNPIQALIFAIMILVLQQFDGLYLGPKILGESTGLTPLWVIFGITLGGAYAGVLGMFLGVPFVAVFAYLANKILNNHLKKKGVDLMVEPMAEVIPEPTAEPKTKEEQE